MILIRGGEPERSFQYLERAYQLDPANETQIKLWLADAYFVLEQYDRAAAVNPFNALRKANFQPRPNEFLLNDLLAFTLFRNRVDEVRFREGLVKAGILE